MNEKQPGKYVERDRIWNPVEGKWEPRIDCRYRSTESMWEESSADRVKSAFKRVSSSGTLDGAIGSIKEKIDLNGWSESNRKSNTASRTRSTSEYRGDEGVFLVKAIKYVFIIVVMLIIFGNVGLALISSLFFSFY